MQNSQMKVLKAPRSISFFDFSIFLYNFLFHFHSALLLFYAPLWGSAVLNTASSYQSYTYIFVLLASSALTKPLGASLLLFKRLRNHPSHAFQMTSFLQVLSSLLLLLSLGVTNFNAYYFLLAKLLQGVALGCENSLVRMLFSQNHDRYIQRITRYEMMCIFSYMLGSLYLDSVISLMYMVSVYVSFSIILCVHRLYALQNNQFEIVDKRHQALPDEKVSWYFKIISIMYVAVLQFLYQITFFFPFVLCKMYASLMKIQLCPPMHEKLATLLLFLWDVICLVFVLRFVCYKNMPKVFYAGIFVLVPCIYLFGFIDKNAPYVYIYILQMLTVFAGVCVMVPQMQWGFNALNGKIPHHLLPFSQGALVHIASALWGRLLPVWAVFAIEKTNNLTQISQYALFAMLFLFFVLFLHSLNLKK